MSCGCENNSIDCLGYGCPGFPTPDPDCGGFYNEVDKPLHYNQGSVECIDAIASMLGPEGLKSYCQGSAFKYLWRYNYKGRPIQDLKKAKWYLDKLLSLQVESEE